MLMTIKPDPELPEALLGVYAGLEARLAANETDRGVCLRRRHALLGRIRETPAPDFVTELGEARKLRLRHLELLDQERAIRAEFRSWLEKLATALEDLRAGAEHKHAEAREVVAGKLAGIGYSEPALTAARGSQYFAKSYLAELIGMHPQVVAARARARELERAVDRIINPRIETSEAHKNELRLKALSAELTAAIGENEKSLALV